MRHFMMTGSDWNQVSINKTASQLNIIRENISSVCFYTSRINFGTPVQAGSRSACGAVWRDAGGADEEVVQRMEVAKGHNIFTLLK